MKAIYFLKAATILMGFLIVGGFFVVGHKIAENPLKSKSFMIQKRDVVLEFPENVQETIPCGSKICVMTIGHAQGRRMIIINPESGYPESIVTFKEKM